jgi:hypothetical protein
MPIMYLSLGSGARLVADGRVVAVARKGTGKVGEDVGVGDVVLEGGGVAVLATDVVGVGSVGATSPGG